MKRTTKTYMDVCRGCGGAGFVEDITFDPNVTTSSMTMICPVCNGGKLQVITEVIEEP